MTMKKSKSYSNEEEEEKQKEQILEKENNNYNNYIKKDYDENEMRNKKNKTIIKSSIIK